MQRAVPGNGVHPGDVFAADEPRRVDEIPVLVERLRGDLHQQVGLLEERLVRIDEVLDVVERQHQHVEVHLAAERQPEVARTVPQAAALERAVTFAGGDILRDAKLLKVLKARLVDILEFDHQRPRLRAFVKEREEHRLGLEQPVQPRLVGRPRLEVGILLEDVVVVDTHHRAAVDILDTRVATLVRIGCAVHPQIFPAEREEGDIIVRVPVAHAIAEVRIVQETLARREVVAHRFDARTDRTLHHLELRQDILARGEQKAAAQIGVVRIQAVSVRLIVCGKPRIGDAVQIAHAGTKTAGERLAAHAAHHVDVRLPVIGRRDQDQSLTLRIGRAAHQHALVADGRQRIPELRGGDPRHTALHRGDLDPVGFRSRAAFDFAADEVAGDERTPHLEGQQVVLPRSVHVDTGDLSVSGRHDELAAHRANLLHEQLQNPHRLTNRQAIHRQMRYAVRIHLQLPSRP